jgi:hypothetical protein
MHQDGLLPRARRDGLLEEAVGEELLLYDQESHTAHCLSPIAACLWRHCDGEHDLTGLARLVGVSEDAVTEALHELREKDLLDAGPELMQSAVPGVSRREAIGRAARYGAVAAAGSMIVSATAATPAMASSGEVLSCCQCYKTKDRTEPCACNSLEKAVTESDEACNAYCTGAKGPNCSSPNGSGVLIGTKCEGMDNLCK